MAETGRNYCGAQECQDAREFHWCCRGCLRQTGCSDCCKADCYGRPAGGAADGAAEGGAGVSEDNHMAYIARTTCCGRIVAATMNRPEYRWEWQRGTGGHPGGASHRRCGQDRRVAVHVQEAREQGMSHWDESGTDGWAGRALAMALGVALAVLLMALADAYGAYWRMLVP